MKKYNKIVQFHSKALKKAGMHKLTIDMASLLDHPDLGYPIGEKIDNFDVRRCAEIREKMYHVFCAPFANLALPLPPLERQFYEAVLSSDADEIDITEAKRINDHLSQACIKKGKGNVPNELCNALGIIIETFPSYLRCGVLDRRILVAKMNQLLIQDGYDPVRPDYKAMKNHGASKMRAPTIHMRILVVDDDAAELAKTCTAIAGWNNVTIIPHLHRRAGYTSSDVDMDKCEKLKLIAELVLAKKPDIILMDQGLDENVDGSELILVIREKAAAVIFVANTGGMDEQLRNAGAFPNCRKGEELRPVAQAMKTIA